MSYTYLPVASSMHDEAARRSILSSYEEALSRSGGSSVDGSSVESDESPLFYFVLTGGTERELLSLRERRLAVNPDEPALLIAHPYHNSLPAALELLARVRQDGGVGRIFFLSGTDDGAALGEIARYARLEKVASSFGKARIGRVGDSSDWLVASSQEAEAVRSAYGAELVPIPLEELRSRMRSEGRPSEGEEFDFFSNAEEVRESTNEDISSVVGVYRALKLLVRDFSLDALTLRCFDLVLGEKTTGCFALSRLADEGITAACEGDIPSTLALLWAYRLTGRPAWMANPARLDAASGRLLLAHCTVPRSIIGAYTVRSHFESGLGAAIAGDLAHGKVTLLRLGGRDLDKLWTAEGEVIATPREEGLCRTQAELSLDGDAIRALLAEPLGNHLVMVGGHHAADFVDSFELFPRSRMKYIVQEHARR